MSDLNTFIEGLANAPIAEVRKAAATYNVNWQRTDSKEDIIELIKGALSTGKFALVAVGDAPAPGWARIRIHSDPNPTSSNRPLYVSVNTYSVLIPRDVDIDVPQKVVEVLANAKSSKLKEDTSVPPSNPARWRFQEALNYPFSLVSYTPGPDPRGEYERAAANIHRPRVAFRDKFGYWPKNEEDIRDAMRNGGLEITRVREA